MNTYLNTHRCKRCNEPIAANRAGGWSSFWGPRGAVTGSAQCDAAHVHTPGTELAGAELERQRF